MLTSDGAAEFLAKVPPSTIGIGPVVWGEQQMVPETKANAWTLEGQE